MMDAALNQPAATEVVQPQPTAPAQQQPEANPPAVAPEHDDVLESVYQGSNFDQVMKDINRNSVRNERHNSEANLGAKLAAQ